MKQLLTFLAVCCLIPSCLMPAVSIAQDSPAVSEFVYPLAVVSPSDSLLYVADRNLPGVWKVENGQKSILFQGSKKFRTPLNAVRCLALDQQGKLLAGDSSTREVYRFGDDGQPVPLTGGAIGIPMAITVTADGSVYVADLEMHKIWKLAAEPGQKPTEVASVTAPRGLTADGEGNLLVLNTSDTRGQILKVTADGKVEPVIKGQPFSMPHNIVRTDDGSLFVTDNYQHCVWRVASDGAVEEWVKGNPLDRPVGLCRSSADLLIADPHIRTIFKLTPDKTLSVLTSSP